MLSSKLPDRRGILLTERVDTKWLNSLEPKYHKDLIKFDVNMKTRKVSVGMDAHKNYILEFAEKPEDVIGGFIDLDEQEILYDSTLNIDWNLKMNSGGATLRELTDEKLIAQINDILKEWIELW